jgi:hypothetical protein
VVETAEAVAPEAAVETAEAVAPEAAVEAPEAATDTTGDATDAPASEEA